MSIKAEHFNYPALPRLEDHYELIESPRGTYFWEPDEALPTWGDEPRRLWVVLLDPSVDEPVAIPYQRGYDNAEFIGFMVTTEEWTAKAEAYAA